MNAFHICGNVPHPYLNKRNEKEFCFFFVVANEKQQKRMRNEIERMNEYNLFTYI